MDNDTGSKKLEIWINSDDPTLVFAGEELSKYLGMASGNRIRVNTAHGYQKDIQGVIWIGTFDDLKLSVDISIEDQTIDDVIHIDINDEGGSISGTNPRSVLISVYRFLKEIGFRWIRPGLNGEITPEKKIDKYNVKLTEKPSFKHRGICIEGASSRRNILELIEWMPKAGFNSYFIQFREAFTFFDRWYSHKNNALKNPESFSIEKAREIVKDAIAELKKRGIIYHAVGHGWTCEPLGIPALGWQTVDNEIGIGKEKYFAQIDGKRQLWRNRPLNTNLCYSNPDVRDIMVKDAVNYVIENRDIDVLSFCLADDGNNHCECDECRKKIPADFFVMMLNEIDEKLSIEGIETKISFPIYMDLLWTPETEKINNTNRFILMFCPITRTYSRSFDTSGKYPTKCDYKRNNLKFPPTMEENLLYFWDWKEKYNGDLFLFDYHYWSEHYFDIGSYQITDVMTQDLKNVKKIGIDGFMSCQVQRAFFPTGLGMNVMGKTLWNSDTVFTKSASEYVKDALGSEGGASIVYLKKLSYLFDPAYIRGEKPGKNIQAVKKYNQIPGLINEFMSVIKRNMDRYRDNKCLYLSWYYLGIHADICKYYAGFLKAVAEKNKEGALESYEKLKSYLQENEDGIQPVFDVCMFLDTVRIKLLKKLLQ